MATQQGKTKLKITGLVNDEDFQRSRFCAEVIASIFGVSNPLANIFTSAVSSPENVFGILSQILISK